MKIEICRQSGGTEQLTLSDDGVCCIQVNGVVVWEPEYAGAMRALCDSMAAKSFEYWWYNECPKLVLNSEEELARAAYDAAVEDNTGSPKSEPENFEEGKSESS